MEVLKKPPVKIEDIKLDVFRKMIRMMYGAYSEASIQSLQEAFDLTYALQKYAFAPGIAYVNAYLAREMSKENYLKIYQVASLYSDHKLIQCCLQYCQDDIEACLDAALVEDQPIRLLPVAPTSEAQRGVTAEIRSIDNEVDITLNIGRKFGLIQFLTDQANQLVQHLTNDKWSAVTEFQNDYSSDSD